MFNRIPLNRKTAPFFEERILQLRPEAVPQFGLMTPHVMIAHLDATFRVSLGSAPCDDISTPFLRNPIIRWLVINVMPLPKGTMKAPASIVPEPSVSFEESRDALLHQLNAFLKAVEADPLQRTLDPWLGKISLADWGKIHGVHLDHHLSQFGV